jgi:hypothetical protein
MKDLRPVWLRFRRRLGFPSPKDIVDMDLPAGGYAALKTAVVPDVEVVHARKPRSGVVDHFDYVQKSFAGRTEIEFYHAKLIVLIRREIELADNLRRFEDLWAAEADHLLNVLDTRWLISAADTFMDYGRDAETKALSLAASLFLNTVKLVETERIIQGTRAATDDPDLVASVTDADVTLFDGVTAFRVGRGDMIHNLYLRMQRIGGQSVAGRILITVFDRMRDHDTLYARFAARHTRERTAWWS